MNLGILDRRITIQQATTSANSIGEPIETWVTFAMVSASIIPMNAREYFSAVQTNAERDVQFRIRWLSGLTEKMRIIYDSQTWDIQSIKEIGRREGQNIMGRAQRMP